MLDCHDYARRPLPDHAEATIDLIELLVAELRAGTPREKIGRQLSLLGRVLERRT